MRNEEEETTDRRDRIRRRRRLSKDTHRVCLVRGSTLNPKGRTFPNLSGSVVLPLENILSSSRGCGVHPTVRKLLKIFLSLITSFLCPRSGVFSHPEWVATRKCINTWINKNPTILNMIGFSFIFNARLLIAETVNNESYVV